MRFLDRYAPLVLGVIPTPSYFAYEHAAMFRVYARAGIAAMMFASCGAAIVLGHRRGWPWAWPPPCATVCPSSASARPRSLAFRPASPRSYGRCSST